MNEIKSHCCDAKAKMVLCRNKPSDFNYVCTNCGQPCNTNIQIVTEILEKEIIDNLKPESTKSLLTLYVPLPPSINEAYTSIVVKKVKKGYYTKYITKTILTEKGKAYKEEVSENIQRQITDNEDMARWIQEKIFDQYIYLDLYFVYKDKRQRDSHNYLKILLDTLESVVYANDSKVYPRIQEVWIGCVEKPYIGISVLPYIVNYEAQAEFIQSKYRIEVK